jgi:GntR family transcriptional regulator
MTARPCMIRHLYLQVRDALAERIATGTWKPGMAIPNESDLAREFGVTPATMRKALQLLENEVLITRRRGRATFVNALRFNGVHRSDAEARKGNIAPVETIEGTANEKERLKLCLHTGDRVYRTRGVRLKNQRALMYEERSIPAMLFPRLKDMSSLSRTIVCLAQEHGILLGMAEERISIGEAPPYVADALGVASSSPLAMLDRVVQTIDGRAVEWRVAWSDLGKNHCFDLFTSGRY